jgi:hypothetical protein
MFEPDIFGRVTARSRAVSSTVAVVLLLGLVIVGTSSLVVFGSVALEETRAQSTVERAEQTMAQFDSRVAQVALGRETTQRLSFGEASGSYAVEEEAGSIRVEHLNYSGGGANATIYEGDLGAVVYENGGTTVAYQGGGVWRTDGTGPVRMVSPPEFHYRGSTLTFPVIQIRGGSSAAGAPRAVVSQRSSQRVFPSASTTYPDDQPYHNPASNGQIRITVTSEYYKGWAAYFEQRTEGNVAAVDHANETVTFDLLTLGDQGEFDIPTDGNPLEVRGMAANNLTDLSMTIRPENDKANKLASLDWSLYAEQGGERMEINVDGLSNGECTDDGSDNEADISVFYTDEYGDSYQGWYAEDAVEVTCEGGDNPMLELDLTNSSVEMEYGDLSGKLARYNPSGDAEPSTTFDHFEGDTGRTYASSPDDDEFGTESLNVVVNHYFSHFGPTFDVYSTAGNSGNNVDTDRSEGDSIVYDGNDVITFLHVSENRVVVDFE